MTENYQQPSSDPEQKVPRVVFATSKIDPLFLLATKLLRVDSFEFRDPEQPHHGMDYQEEDSAGDAVTVAIKKAIHARDSLVNWEGKEYGVPIFTSDINFFFNGEQMHQLARNPKDRMRFAEKPWEFDRERLKTIERYQQPFEPVWHTVFVFLHDNGRIDVAQNEISCGLIDGLSPEESYYNFLPSSNAHLRLVELLNKRGVQFKIRIQAITQEKRLLPLPGEIAEQYIVAKVPDRAIFWSLLNKEPSEMQQMGNFQIALMTMADWENI